MAGYRKGDRCFKSDEVWRYIENHDCLSQKVGHLVD